MIVNFLHKSEKYRHLHPSFPAAFDFLASMNAADLAFGRQEIDGENLFAIIERAQGKGLAEARLEAHRRYIDIQYIIEGGDTIGIRPVGSCSHIMEPYDANRDIGFFGDAPVEWISLPAGSFIILFPEDAHAPLAGQGEVLKAIMKVSVRK